MKNLKNYLDRNEISHYDFANQVGISQSSLEKYIYTDRVPRLDIAHKIVVRTKGALTYEDLLDDKYLIKDQNKSTVRNIDKVGLL